MLGFACYDATARGYFGPIGVMVEQHIPGTGGALLRRCLTAMREEGYGYVIIGNGSRVQKFYEKEVGAVLIPESSPGIYQRMIAYKQKSER